MTSDSPLSTTPRSANEQIHRVLTAYCRGVDRLDATTLGSAFHPGATLKGYGRRDRSADEFVPFAIEGLRRTYAATQHRLGNIDINIGTGTGTGTGTGSGVAGDSARVESYVTAEHLLIDGDQRRLHIFTGRYIDDFESIDDVWRIRTRTLRHDWTNDLALTGFMPGDWTDGSRDQTDPVYG